MLRLSIVKLEWLLFRLEIADNRIGGLERSIIYFCQEFEDMLEAEEEETELLTQNGDL